MIAVWTCFQMTVYTGIIQVPDKKCQFHSEQRNMYSKSSKIVKAEEENLVL